MPLDPDFETADVTALLRAWRDGDTGAAEALFARVYSELKRIAAAQFRSERRDHTLEPTAVVNEAYLRLLGQRRIPWRERAHFFGLAAATMRRVLVDHARARRARKRRPPGDFEALTLVTANGPEAEVLDLDVALDRLAQSYPRQAKVVEMRYFADLEIEDIAACLEISPATVKRDWQFARAWLKAELAGGG